MKRVLYLFFIGVMSFSLSYCSSNDDNSPLPPNENPENAYFEADIDLADQGGKKSFKAMGDHARISYGSVDMGDGEIPNVLLLEFEDDTSNQALTLLATGVTGLGTYTMGKGDFEVAPLFSVYKLDKEDSDLKNLYTFHKQSIEFDGKVYKTEVVLKITSLTEDRIVGTLDIVMYSSVLEYEGTGTDKKLVGGFVHEGAVAGEFDMTLTRP